MITVGYSVRSIEEGRFNGRYYIQMVAYNPQMISSFCSVLDILSKFVNVPMRIESHLALPNKAKTAPRIISFSMSS
jgi:hypothetical protein